MRRYVLCSHQSRSSLCFRLRAPFHDRDGSDAHMEHAEASDLGDGEQRLACSPAYRKPCRVEPTGFKFPSDAQWPRRRRSGRGGASGGGGAECREREQAE